jgi:hypothetical protein
MEAKGCRTVRAKIDRIGIFLTSLNPVNLIVIQIEFIVVKFVAYQLAKQNEDSKSDNKICKVNNRKNLVVPNVSKNVDKKMFDHGFEFSK